MPGTPATPPAPTPPGRPPQRRPAPARPLRASRRLAAWLVTGPIGHLVAGALDVLVFAAQRLWARARGRDPDAT